VDFNEGEDDLSARKGRAPTIKGRQPFAPQKSAISFKTG